MRRVTLAGTVMALTLATALAPAAQAEPTENYLWRTDGISKTLAGKPFADRVPVSYTHLTLPTILLV